MNTDYTIKNFRVFDSKGATIPLRPITILTGCNSSGKSSIVKSMVLLDTFLKPLREDYENGHKIDPSKYKLDFTTSATASLGNFEKVLSNGAKDREIHMEYTVFSDLVCKDLKVHFTFVVDDVINQGKMKSIVITDDEKNIYYEAGETSPYDISHLKESFFRFVKFEDIVDTYLTKRILLLFKSDSFYGDYVTDTKDEIENSYLNNLHNLTEKYGKNKVCQLMWWWIKKGKWSNIGKQSLLHKYSHGHTDFFDSAYNLNVINYFPRLEQLASETKETILEKIDELFANDEEVHKEFYLIASDFINTPDCNQFIEYYCMKENKSLTLGGSLELFYEKWSFPSSKFTKSVLSEDKELPYSMINRAFVLDDGNYSMTFNDLFITIDSRDQQFYIKRIFSEFVRKVQDEALAVNISKNLSYIGSSIFNNKRLYSLEEKDDFTMLLSLYFETKSKYIGKEIEGIGADSSLTLNFEPGDFINKWIQKFNIGKMVTISSNLDGTGVTLRLRKSDEDYPGLLLVDEGSGVTQLVAILLRIEIAIMERTMFVAPKDEKFFYPPQYLKDEELDLYSFVSTIALEEPEAHLHPRFQSLLADMIEDAYNSYNVQFIVETHSEYLIRKLQTLIGRKDNDLTPKDVSIIYIYPHDKALRPAGEPQVKVIKVEEDGTLATGFGSGFFDEADSLALELMQQNLN